MSDTVNVALVGYGMAGKVFHAPLIAGTAGLNLSVVVSSDATKVHADWPDVTVVRDLDAALQRDDVDLVVIATPDELHAAQAEAALRAGKHVVIDKPLAPTPEEALHVAKCAAASGKRCAVFQNRRWDADFLTVKRLIAAGTLGDIIQFESHFDRYRPDVQDRWKDRRAGGIWQDLGPHLVDQALNLFGMPIAIFADLASQRAGATAPDYAHVVMRYDRLRVILHISQSTHAYRRRYFVHGTKASYQKLGTDPQEDQSKAGLKPEHPEWDIDHDRGTLICVQDDGTTIETAIENERGNYLAFYSAMRDAVLGNAPCPVPPAEALDVMHVLAAGITSAETGREARL